MMIHEITEKVGQHKRRRRLGRGEGSGRGKTAGRGHKGAGSRSGWSLNQQFEGGQINFIQKMPKRGFSNAHFRKLYHIINLSLLDKIANDGQDINAEFLAQRRAIRDANLPLKILGHGNITKKINVTAARFSASAKSKIEAAGGTINELDPAPVKKHKPKDQPQSAAEKKKPKSTTPKKTDENRDDKPEQSDGK